MLNWIPALFLLLMHGAVATEGAARDTRLPLGAVAFVQSAARPNAKGAALSATLRTIARYGALADEHQARPAGEALRKPCSAPVRPMVAALPRDPAMPSSRTRDGPSVV